MTLIIIIIAVTVVLAVIIVVLLLLNKYELAINHNEVIIITLQEYNYQDKRETVERVGEIV